MSEKIKVTIKPNGNSVVEVSGVKGSGCKALTAALEAALGTPSSDVPTTDMYENEQQQTENQY